MVAEVALAVLQVSEELPPAGMLVGVAVSEQVGVAAKTSPIPTKKAVETTKIDSMNSFNVFLFMFVLSH